MFAFTLIVIGCLCIAFKPVRHTGLAILTLVSLACPPLFLLFLVLGSIALLVHYKSK